jgi:hypothetical protein
MSYNSPKPDAVLEEDEVIQDLPLQFSDESVQVVPAAEVFSGS